MSCRRSRWQISRRKFAFWIGLGLFTLGEKLRADSLDELAAATMRATEPTGTGPKDNSASKDNEAKDGAAKTDAKPASIPEHWTASENNTWRWFEREHLIGGQWKLTGITTPIHKQTGERHTGQSGYLDDKLVPESVRRGEPQPVLAGANETAVEDDPGRPNAMRRARHGRPPSRWLRSLKADELRIWLKTIDVPEAGVEGMTFWEHLTRDHSFVPEKIEGLNEDEQAKLHAAAHYGY